MLSPAPPQPVWPDFLHPAVALRWARVQLEANANWTAIHGPAITGRTYDESKVPPKAQAPFGVISQRDNEGTLYLASQQMIAKKEVLLTAVSVRVYPQGKSSVFDFADSYHALWESLCQRFVCDEVFDLNDRKIGEVWDVTWIRDVEMLVPDGDYDVFHHGLTVKVIYR